MKTNRIVCAWCEKVMQEGPEPTTHGICPDCAENYLGTLGTLCIEQTDPLTRSSVTSPMSQSRPGETRPMLVTRLTARVAELEAALSGLSTAVADAGKEGTQGNLALAESYARAMLAKKGPQ